MSTSTPQTTVPDPVLWTYLDIESDEDGWWVVRLGCTKAGGVPVKEPLRLFPHSRLDSGSARYAAHCHAFNLSNTTDRRYLT